jgi:arginyl-tRNA synthetase
LIEGEGEKFSKAALLRWSFSPPVYLSLQDKVVAHVRDTLKRLYDIELPEIAVSQPPNVELGEYALTFAFELAKKLRKAPKKIAEEVVAALGTVPDIARFEVAGAGYINAFVDREAFAGQFLGAQAGKPVPQGAGQPGKTVPQQEDKVLVEHTSINPNKAAHVGHLRNAILGDTLVRLLRSGAHHVDIQNYIDNTGVQVADVVVGFQHLEKRSKAEVQKMIDDRAARGDRPFDYYCWDLYARVSQWYEESEENKKIRLHTLHEIERGGNEAAEIGEIVSRAVLRRHLETMLRLGIKYDFLPRESEILHLHFWDAAFELMKKKGVLTRIESGKHAGCWVMVRTGGAIENEEDQKVIVRSNGTVTYVGKDIAYHLWKFGLLGKDFGYQRFFHYPDGHTVWISAETSEPDHPHFGGVNAIYNVIDSRQADPQNNVIEALRKLGYNQQADRYTHFSYEMVALTPRCAEELGYKVPEEDKGRAYIEVSGRKGFGVKADDLIDRLIEAAKAEVDARHPERDNAQRRQIATQIAVGALRYFMLKYTRSSVIAFDFKDALSFEGETGPYCQYAIVRATNIFRKGNTTPEASLAGKLDFEALRAEHDIWEVWVAASKLTWTVDQAIKTAEPAYVAKYAFQLAQSFNNFYHRHHILTEENEGRKRLLLATAALVRRELISSLKVMGIEAPEVM